MTADTPQKKMFDMDSFVVISFTSFVHPNPGL